jgi:hypothetical protein
MRDIAINDTLELFIGLHRYNPYAKKMRKEFLLQLESIEQLLQA